MIIDHRWTWKQYVRSLSTMKLKARYLFRDPEDVDANRALAAEIERRENERASRGMP